MNIAVFHNLGAGGAKRQLFEQAKSLAARGHSLDLFVTSAEDAHEFLPLAPFCRAVRVYGDDSDGRSATAAAGSGGGGRLRAKLGGITVGRAVLEWFWAGRTGRGLQALSHHHVQIARDMDANGYDAAYICQCRRLLAPDVLRFLHRTPALFCCNDTLRVAYEWQVTPEAGYDAAPQSLFRRKSRGRFFSPALAAFDAREEHRFVANTRAAQQVVANSWYTRDRILGVAGVSARVCYPGVDFDFYCPYPQTSRDRNLVVSVGALLATKRHEFVLRAVATISAAARPGVEIIGYESRFGESGLGPEGRRLCALAEQLGVRLTLQKDVTDELVRNAYRRAGAVAFAPYLEPLGMVPLEAMACGAAVVGVAEAGLRETISDGQTGLLTDFDPQAFGAGLTQVLTNPIFAQRLGEQGRARVMREWTWTRTADTLEKLLVQTAQQGRG